MDRQRRTKIVAFLTTLLCVVSTSSNTATAVEVNEDASSNHAPEQKRRGLRLGGAGGRGSAAWTDARDEYYEYRDDATPSTSADRHKDEEDEANHGFYDLSLMTEEKVRDHTIIMIHEIRHFGVLYIFSQRIFCTRHETHRNLT